MFIRIIFIVWAMTVISPTFSPMSYAAHDVPSLTVEKGVLDLRKQGKLEQMGNITLNGQWEFYWRQLLTPEEIRHGAYADSLSYITVPAVWSSQSINDQPLVDEGYGTYRMVIYLPPEEVGQAQALRMPSVATSYQLWVNGELLANNGKVDTNRDDMQPQNYPKPVYFTPANDTLDIVIQVSNYAQRKGGLWSEIRYGDAERMTAERDKDIIAQITVISALFVIGFYHIGMFVFRSKERSALLFGLSCLCVSLRTLFVGELLWFQFWPDFNWEIGVKIEYISAFMGIGLFVIYFYHLYPKDTSRKTAYGIFSLIAAMSLTVLVLPARMYTHAMLYYQFVLLGALLYLVYVVLMVTMRKRRGAWINFSAMLLIFLAVLNDVLYYNHIVRTGEWFGIGVYVFIIAQAFVLASRFTQSFSEVEKLSDELNELNQSLEQKVKQRTEELNIKNRQLNDMQQVRAEMLASIAHDLSSPILGIQMYAELTKEGRIKSGDDTFLHQIHENSSYMKRLVDDLFELSKLELKEQSFRFEYISVKPWFEDIIRRFKMDLQVRDFHLQLSRVETMVSGQDVYIHIDKIRIHQVIQNMMDNAVKFSKDRSDNITINCFITKHEQLQTSELRLEIIDFGPGLSANEIPLVFNRFYKKEGNDMGSGLGLTIVQAIIEEHQGRVGVESVKGQGSTFYFTLPIVMNPPDSRR